VRRPGSGRGNISSARHRRFSAVAESPCGPCAAPRSPRSGSRRDAPLLRMVPASLPFSSVSPSSSRSRDKAVAGFSAASSAASNAARQLGRKIDLPRPAFPIPSGSLLSAARWPEDRRGIPPARSIRPRSPRCRPAAPSAYAAAKIADGQSRAGSDCADWMKRARVGYSHIHRLLPSPAGTTRGAISKSGNRFCVRSRPILLARDLVAKTAHTFADHALRHGYSIFIGFP